MAILTQGRQKAKEEEERIKVRAALKDLMNASNANSPGNRSRGDKSSQGSPKSPQNKNGEDPNSPEEGSPISLRGIKKMQKASNNIMKVNSRLGL